MAHRLVREPLAGATTDELGVVLGQDIGNKRFS